MAQQAASFHRMKQFVRHLVETQESTHQCRKDYLEMVQDVRSLISLQFTDKPGFIDYTKSMCNVCVYYFCLNIICNLPFYSLEML